MEIYVQAIEQAANTWGIIRRIPDYEMVVGMALFKNIFELAPAALEMYSFAKDWKGKPNTTRSKNNFNKNTSNTSHENMDTLCVTSSALNYDIPSFIFESAAFRTHATGVVTTMGMVVQMMIGDAMSDLAETLHSLGARHIAYGVHPAHYKILETALLRTIEDALPPERWTVQVRKGWAAVIKFISKGMQAGAGSELEILKTKRRSIEDDRASAEMTLRLTVIRQSHGTSRLRRSHSNKTTSLCSEQFALPRRESIQLGPLKMTAWPQEHDDGNDQFTMLSRRYSDILPRSGQGDRPPCLPRRNSTRDAESLEQRLRPTVNITKTEIVEPFRRSPTLSQQYTDNQGEHDDSSSTESTVGSTTLDETDCDTVPCCRGGDRLVQVEASCETFA